MANTVRHLLLLLSVFVLHVTSFDCDASNGEKLQIHLVPHTHDDVGWLKTVDEYFYGSNRTIQGGAVQYILDTVVTALEKDIQKTFIYVEMAFFKRWWDQQEQWKRDNVQALVKNGQLEFINGGWCMNDEAAAHYNAIIDQMTLGLRFIEETFGSYARPTVAWHIDPFGHSAEQASLFSLMSFDGFFFGRIDQADKDKRIKEQRMEMMWRGSANYGNLSQIFTGVLYNGYNPPPGFCYDQFCSDPPIQDDPKLFDVNVKERVDTFVRETCEQAKSYQTNHIILTMGSDFQFENAHRWYKNLDKLIRYVNEDGRVNVFYSTPSRYLKALHEAEKEWEVKTDDFFPYAHCPHCYWTGYFTSRPAQKGYIRESNNMLQACKQLEAINSTFDESPSSMSLRRAMAVNQHHDAVTGTEKQHVQNDYAKRMYIGRQECKAVMASVLSRKLVPNESTSIELEFQYCDYLNISVCPITETEKSIIVSVYNPIARPVNAYVRVPVDSNKLIVFGSKGEPVQSQILPLSKQTKKLKKNHKSSAKFELVFEVCAPAVGYATFFINKTAEKNIYMPWTSRSTTLKDVNNVIENNKLRLEFSSETGRLVKMSRKDRDLTLAVDQQFFWYNGSEGNSESRQTSGAYIFRPNRSEPYQMCSFNKAKVKVIVGPLVQEIRQTFGNFVSQVIRLYENSVDAEFEHTVGPIPIKDKLGKEIITRFDTSIKSDGLFYTDANGREIKERKRDYRATWKLKITEPVSENYYPVNSRIFIKDSSTQLTIMSDRSQGGSSIKDGQVEVMLHRRLLVDDFLGVGEPLNEPGVDGRGLVTRGVHRVLLTTPQESAAMHRELGEKMLLKPILSFAAHPHSPNNQLSNTQPIYSALTKPLPDNVHLLTMETISAEEMILRFEHMFEKEEDFKLSQPVTVDLDGLFTDFRIWNLTETNLSANQYLSDKHQWHWQTKESQTPSGNYGADVNGLEITLQPMEIRTFLAKVRYA